MSPDCPNNVFSLPKTEFSRHAIRIFNTQYELNPVYRAYADALNIFPDQVKSLHQIPFLPIQFFKSHEVKTGSFQPEIIFESSGTTGSVPSRHLVKDRSVYEQSFIKGFELFYGPIKDYCILGLLPSYLERKGSSLIMMVDELIRLSQHEKSGFYLDEFDNLALLLRDLESRKQKTLLIGVTFALLDFAEKFPMVLQHTILMETGGMKGRRKELTRPEVHEILKTQFHLPMIHAEYGMTELLSQAYSKGNGIFESVPWMKVMIREEDDPLIVKETGSGIINIIDLANIYSCSFIATDDAGTVHDDKTFAVSGRVDHSDLRGCSLLVL